MYLCARFLPSLATEIGHGVFFYVLNRQILIMSDVITLPNVNAKRGENSPQDSVWLTPDAFPEAKSSKTGVSVRYVESPEKRWYILRASYGRESKASDYIVEDGTYTYVAKKMVEKYVRGKKRKYLQTLIPNLLFVYTTKEKAEEYVSHTPAVSYLSYYYNHFTVDSERKNPPLTVSPVEMRSFILATCSMNKHLLFVKPSQCHFKSGEMVKVVEGTFAGVEGLVARVAGQQRVVVTLSHIGLVSTAYIPTAFLRRCSSE